MNTTPSGDEVRDRVARGEADGEQDEMNEAMNQSTNRDTTHPADDLGLEGELEAMARRLRAEPTAGVSTEPPAGLEKALLEDLRHAVGSNAFDASPSAANDDHDAAGGREVGVFVGLGRRMLGSPGLRAAAALIVVVGFSALLVRNGFLRDDTDRLRSDELSVEDQRPPRAPEARQPASVAAADSRVDEAIDATKGERLPEEREELQPVASAAPEPMDLEALRSAATDGAEPQRQPLPAPAEADATRLEGRVTGADGGAIPGVQVSVRGAESAVQFTDEKGEYGFEDLNPGQYELRARLDGFSSVEYPAVEVEDDRSATVDFQMEPAVEETITVTSETPLLEERKIEQGAQVNQTELEKAPGAEDRWVGAETEVTFRGGSPSVESAQEGPFDGDEASRDAEEMRQRLQRLPRGLRGPAEQSVVSSEAGVADDSEAKKLRALGYVGSERSREPDAAIEESVVVEPDRRSRRRDAAEPTAPDLDSDRIFVAERAREVPDQPRVHIDRFDAMTFRDYGISPFVDTEQDAQSTFGLEVDTGSFNLARRYLDAGTLPPPAAIRVEEIVNALDYADPAPRRDDFAISVEGTVSPYDADKVLLRVGVKARELRERSRPAAALTFLIDTSGSMNRENRLGLVQNSLEYLIDRLEPGDTVAIVTYGSRGRVELEPTSDRERIRSVVRSLRPGGSTNLEEGMRLAYEIAGRRTGRGAVSRVILCSDGVANVGLTDAESLLRSVAEWGARGVELTAVGVGLGNYNDEMLERLAGRGDGRYAYVDQLDEARRLFVEDLTGTLFTVGKDARVQVTFDPDQVARYRLIGYENRAIPDHRFRDRRTDGGEIGAGHAVSAVYELELRGAASPGWFDRVRGETLGEVALVYRRVGEDGPASDLSELTVPLRSGAVVSRFDRASASLRLAVTAARFAEILRVSPYVEGDLSALFEQAQAIVPAFPGDRRVVQLVDMIGAARDRL